MSLMVSQPKIDISSPVQPTAAFDPPVVGPGQQAIYRVTFNALEETIDWPEKINAPAGLPMTPGAHGEILRMGPGSFLPLTAFNYHVRPTSPGTFNVAGFTVNVYGKPVTVPAARLDVVSAPPAPAQPAPRILLELPATNLFVGQAVRARVLLPGSLGGAVLGLAQVQISGHGFLVDLGGARQRIEMLPFGAGRIPTYIYDATLTPMVEGNITLFAQGFVGGGHFLGSIVIAGGAFIPGGAPQYTLVETDPVELHVRPLPPEGELPGFTGAIGSFELGKPRLGTNVLRVGGVVSLAVTVTNLGDGPLARLVAPPAPHLTDWQVFPPTEVAPPMALPLGLPGIPGPGDKLLGVTTFNYTLIPLTERRAPRRPSRSAILTPSAAAMPISPSHPCRSRSKPAPRPATCKRCCKPLRRPWRRKRNPC